MKIELLLTPAPLAHVAIEGRTVIVIDVLRSSTSICFALQAGARGVIPVNGPGEAGAMRNNLGADVAVLAGETEGVRIDNFQFGNSPLEFTSDAVGDKLVVMATTNGTAPFAVADKAATMISCGFVNITAVAEALAASDEELLIVCAGRRTAFSVEDTLCGGMLAHLLQSRRGVKIENNDAARMAGLLYDANSDVIAESVRQGEHGRFLTSIGFAADIEAATAIDSVPVVPVFKNDRLVLAAGN